MKGSPKVSPKVKRLMAAVERFLRFHDLTCKGPDCSEMGIDDLRYSLKCLKGERGRDEHGN